MCFHDIRQQLLEFKCHNALLPQNVWQTIKAYGINRPYRRRGFRAGRRKQHPIPTVISGHRYKQHHKDRPCHPNEAVLTRPKLVNLPEVTTDNSHNCVRTGLINARSVVNKCGVISELVLERDLSLLAVTETWLRKGDDSVINNLCPPAYNFVSVPRPDHKSCRGGGIGLLHKSTLEVETVHRPHFPSFEHLCVRVKLLKPVLICVIYRPPPSARNGLTTQGFLSDIQEFLASITTDVTEDLCVVGDFNIHLDISDDTTAKQFLGTLLAMDLQQLVTQPTHKAGHILDLVLVRSGSTIISPVEVQDVDLSDHCLLQFSIKHPPAQKSKILLSRRKLKDIDMVDFSADIGSALADCVQDSELDSIVTHYNQCINRVLDQHAPPRNITLKGETDKCWYYSEVHEARWNRRHLRDSTQDLG